MRVISLAIFIYIVFWGMECLSAQVAILYRKDIPFYRSVVEKFEKTCVQICPLERMDECFNNDLKMVIALGDLAFRKVLSYKYHNKYKIYAFFVTECHPNAKICCFYLFPTPQEVFVKLKTIYPHKKIIYLYTQKTKWWIGDFSSAPKYLLRLQDVKESLRKIFLKKFDVLVLAPDLLFMHPVFLKDLVVLALSTSKILVGLSPIMLDYGVDVVIYYDYNDLFSQLSFGHKFFLDNVRIPLKVVIYGHKNS